VASIKGVKVERAKPSNIVDITAMVREYAKESKGIKLYPIYTDADVEEYTFHALEAIKSPNNIYLLARRGRSYWGFVHGRVYRRPYGSPVLCMYVEMLHVLKAKRKLGVGNLLADSIEKEARKLGVGAIELMCKDELIKKWESHGAKKRFTFMSKELV